MGADQLAVVLFEIAIELGYLNEFRGMSMHEVLPTKRPGSSQTTDLPDGASPFRVEKRPGGEVRCWRKAVIRWCAVSTMFF
jgi:hypothetical protein